jgi:ABC-2 type transport system permease protein
VTEEIERGTLELLRVAPVSLVDVIDGKALGTIALAPAQVVLWFGLLALNGITVDNPLALLALVTAVTTVVVALGITLALATRRRRQAQLLYSTVVLLLFGLAAGLPEHPATTVAKLAVGSGTLATLAHVGLFILIAAGLAYAVRRYVAGIDASRLA